MGGKRLRVNVDKAKGMQLLFGKKSSVSKVDPCGICNERVGCNSIQCVESQMWDYPSSSSSFFFFFFFFLMCLGMLSLSFRDVFVELVEHERFKGNGKILLSG